MATGLEGRSLCVSLVVYYLAVVGIIAGVALGRSQSAGVDAVGASADLDNNSLCTAEDFDTTQTKCDENGQRWFVGVPKFESTCQGGYMPAPKPGRPCNYTCKTGQYMRERSMECLDCSMGTYSLGDGARWENFLAHDLPGGFSIEPRNTFAELRNIKGVISQEQHQIVSSINELQNIFHSERSRARREAEYRRQGFSVSDITRQQRDVTDEDAGSDDDSDDSMAQCAQHGWKAMGGHFLITNPECSSSVSLEVDLVRDGEVRFQYSYPDAAPFFLMIEVKSYTCTGSAGSTHSYKALNHTHLSAFDWGKVNLNAGHNVISFLAITNFGSYETSVPIMIKRIEVSGLPYAMSCTPCPVGTSNAETGSSWCSNCEGDTFSSVVGSERCSTCTVATQYPNDDHTGCIDRKPCTADDYLKMYSACDANGKTNVRHEWSQPKLCVGGLALPATQRNIPCPPCNRGMSVQSNHSQGACSYCPAGSVADGTKACEACKPGSQAITGMDFNWWTEQAIMSDMLFLKCERSDGAVCPEEGAGWHLNTNYLGLKYSALSGSGTANINIYVAEFAGLQPVANMSDVVGTLQFAYEIKCPAESCSFAFFDESMGVGGSEEVWEWKGASQKGKFTYYVKSMGYHDFHWMFSIDGSAKAVEDYDVIKIRYITINDTVDGGGIDCKDCTSLGLSSSLRNDDNNADDNGDSRDGSCMGCPAGNYLNMSDAANHRCIPCPAGTALSGQQRIGKEACLQCGPGTISAAGASTCYSDCTYRVNENVLYNFTSLLGPQAVRSSSRFTPRGTHYVYEYQVSVCGGALDAECSGNVTVHQSHRSGKFLHSYRVLDAKVCRHTVAYSKDKTVLLRGYPLAFGMHLVAVEHIKPMMTRTAVDALSLRTMNTSQASVSLANRTGDSLISFFYHAEQGESRCENGRMSVVNLHCDATKEGDGELHLVTSDDCPEGTCDGCTFNFIWHTAHACRVCRDSDYRKLEGRCSENGTVPTEYVWNGPNGQKHCYGGVSLPGKEEKPCSIKDRTVGDAFKKYLPFILAIPAIVLLVLLALIVVVCKNRRLTYQYQKLVQSASAAGELPAPPTCGEDDEDEEEVMFAQGQSKTKSLVRKLQNLTTSSSKRRHKELEADVMLDELPLNETDEV